MINIKVVIMQDIFNWEVMIMFNKINILITMLNNINKIVNKKSVLKMSFKIIIQIKILFNQKM